MNEDSLKFLVDGGRKKLGLVELMQMDEITAAKLDREQQLYNFTYQFKRGHSADFVNVLAVSREFADEQFKRMQPSITKFTVTGAPMVEATQRTYAAVHRKFLRAYFETCGIDPDTGKGEATKDQMKAAMDQLYASSTLDLFNNVLRFGGYQSVNAKPKCPSAVFKQLSESLGLVPEIRVRFVLRALATYGRLVQPLSNSLPKSFANVLMMGSRSLLSKVTLELARRAISILLII